MRIFNFKVSDFEKEYDAPEGLFQSEHAIVDNEIANNLAPDWDYTKADIICTGILQNAEMTIFLREEEDTAQFKEALKLNLNKDVTYHAFNRNMEFGNFVGFLDKELLVKEIKPFKAKGWNKEAFFEQLMRDEVIPKVKIYDPFLGDGGQCIVSWKIYLQSNDNEELMKVVMHNVNCLLKEAVILKHKDHFEKNWRIDNKGFMLERK
mgnify:CR=1 FL=1